jgi:hypothetical protein
LPCYDQFFFHNLALVLVKNANFFAIFFGENILKIITLVPGPDLFTSGLFLGLKLGLPVGLGGVLVMRVVLTLGDERKDFNAPG